MRSDQKKYLHSSSSSCDYTCLSLAHHVHTHTHWHVSSPTNTLKVRQGPVLLTVHIVRLNCRLQLKWLNERVVWITERCKTGVTAASLRPHGVPLWFKPLLFLEKVKKQKTSQQRFKTMSQASRELSHTAGCQQTANLLAFLLTLCNELLLY